MPDDTSTIWVDTTFSETEDGDKDSYVEYQTFAADNIGSYSIPVVVQFNEDGISSDVNTWVEYFNEIAALDTNVEIPVEYFVFELPYNTATDDVTLEFFQQTSTQSGITNVPLVYTTGYNTISGSFNKRVVFTAGKEYSGADNVPVALTAYAQSSGTIDKRVNYTNFSGNVGPSGIPIPFFDDTLDYIAEYFGRGNGPGNDTTSGSLDRIVDISFAGWVDTAIPVDVYCAVDAMAFGFEMEATVSAGGLLPNYVDVICADLTTSGIETDVICALVDMAYTNSEVEIVPGRIGYITQDVYSTIEVAPTLTMDIELFSLKFDNFSPDIGTYNEAQDYIAVDVLDDVCPISVSGTYFLVDGVKVPTTLSGISGGYRMYYDPIDDFSSITGTTVFTAHAENECGNTLEQDYYLTFGYFVEYINDGLMDYGMGNKVVVRITAEDYASCPTLEGTAWDFESKDYHSNDLGATITGRNYALETSTISAEIWPQSTAYFYGKEFTVVVNAKDFGGNEMEPLVLVYKIEDKP